MLDRLTALAGCLAAQLAMAQPTSLPAPSRTVYKCVVADRVVYSDTPCAQAERLDVTPTRGMNKSTGRELTGADVRHEQHREIRAKALRPITGESKQQYETRHRRAALSSNAKVECSQLDARVAKLEGEDRSAVANVRPQVQQRLFAARTRYRELGY
jgi:hypothetical protein